MDIYRKDKHRDKCHAEQCLDQYSIQDSAETKTIRYRFSLPSFRHRWKCFKLFSKAVILSVFERCVVIDIRVGNDVGVGGSVGGSVGMETENKLDGIFDGCSDRCWERLDGRGRVDGDAGASIQWYSTCHRCRAVVQLTSNN